MADGDRQAIPEIRVGVPTVGDFAYLAHRLRPDEREQFAAMTGKPYDPEIAAQTYIVAHGLKYVLVSRDGLPVAAGCFEYLRDGVLETWGIGTPDAWVRYWRAITKVCRRQIDQLLDTGTHRIQITALASRTAAHEWYIRGLGMTREGVLKGYCADGRDAVVFARTKEATR